MRRGLGDKLTPEDLAMYERIKKIIGSKITITEFVKLLNCYNQDLGSPGWILSKARDYLDNDVAARRGASGHETKRMPGARCTVHRRNSRRRAAFVGNRSTGYKLAPMADSQTRASHAGSASRLRPGSLRPAAHP